MPESRIPTAVDALAERHLAAAVELSPVLATYLGQDVGQDRYDDFSPDGRAASAALARHTVAEAACLTPQDEVDRVTLTVLNERLGLQLETHEARADLLSVNGIASDLHSIREVYDLMPQSGDDDWAMIARRLQAVPLGRIGRPREVAEAIVWLMSPAASYTTATLMDVSGGR